MVDKKHLHSIRIGLENWLYEDRFEHLLRLLKEYRGGITDVALFTTPTHTPLALDKLFQYIAVIGKRLPALREAGFFAGINHLPTIGHHCEDLGSALGDKYTYMTNIEGESSPGTYCMRHSDFVQEYVVPCYAEMVHTHPDFIWIDDDIRYGHMGMGNGCFCDHCIAVFNKKFGHDYTRETLKSALSENNPALGMEWLEHQSDAICDLLRAIAETVYGIDPKIKLGLMTGERYFEGYQFARYADALSLGGTHEIMWRPGGGAYDDFNIRGMLEKMQELGRQNAYLPDYVSIIQSEIENFPYNLIKKTARSTAFEAAMSMTVGCTGAAFNIVPSETLESLDSVVPYLRFIDRMTGFYQILQEKLEGMKPSGIHTGWRPFSLATSENGILGRKGYSPNHGREMFYFGLPEAYHPACAPVTMLSGQGAAVMTDEEILKLLSGGVYIDAPAVKYLHARGFGELIGFSAGESIPADATEQYIDHELNEGFAGGMRNSFQAFYSSDSIALIPMFKECQILSRLIDYHGRVLCECASGIYENRLGGRICAAGYSPRNLICDYLKTKQLKQIFLWLSKGMLPSFVESYERIRNMTLTGEGRTGVALYNSTNDEKVNVSVYVHTDSDEAVLYLSDGTSKRIYATRKEACFGGQYHVYEIDRIAAFDQVLLLCEEDEK